LTAMTVCGSEMSTELLLSVTDSDDDVAALRGPVGSYPR
jgi:hypothetical protein